MDILSVLFLNPFINILFFLFKIFGNDLGLAIIALTVLFKLVTLPLNLRMLRSQRRMQQLKPKLDKLKEQHGSDKMALAQAQMDLYKLEGVSPTGACLPMLLQIPFLLGLYQAFRYVVDSHSVEELNAIFYTDWLNLDSMSQIDLNFLWFDLSKPDGTLILPVLAALSQFALSKMMATPKAMLPKPKDQSEVSLENSLLAAQGQMIYLFPIMTFIINLQFPAALALYWTVGNIFSISQQIYINKKHPITTLNDQRELVPVDQLEEQSGTGNGKNNGKNKDGRDTVIEGQIVDQPAKKKAKSKKKSTKKRK